MINQELLKDLILKEELKNNLKTFKSDLRLDTKNLLKTKNKNTQDDFKTRDFYDSKINKLELDLKKINRKIEAINPKDIFQTERYFNGLTYDMNVWGPWFLEKEIRVYKQIGVPDSWVSNTIKGVQGAVNDLGLDLRIENCGAHKSIEDIIKQSSNFGLINVRVLGNLLGNEIYRKKEKGGKPHADVVVLKEYGKGKVIKGSFGIGDFDRGYIIMWENSQRVTKHEVGHLLGIASNHETDDTLRGYHKDNDCLMWWRVSSPHFCEYCLDTIKYFWKGLEVATGTKYFK